MLAGTTGSTARRSKRGKNCGMWEGGSSLFTNSPRDSNRENAAADCESTKAVHQRSASSSTGGCGQQEEGRRYGTSGCGERGLLRSKKEAVSARGYWEPSASIVDKGGDMVDGSTEELTRDDRLRLSWHPVRHLERWCSNASVLVISNAEWDLKERAMHKQKDSQGTTTRTDSTEAGALAMTSTQQNSSSLSDNDPYTAARRRRVVRC